MSTTERVLISTADDCGLAAGVTEGILELAQAGSITATSVLMNLPESGRAVEAARRAGLAVGVHLNVTLGRPLSAPETVPTLLGVDGCFVPTVRAVAWRAARGTLRLTDVEREWSAQIAHFLAVGGTPAHLDTHAHLHILPGFHALFIRLARHYGVPRVRGGLRGQVLQAPGLWVGTLGAGGAGLPAAPWQAAHLATLTVMGKARTARPVQQLIRALPPGITELVCHPSRADADLRRWDSFAHGRERERLLLSRPWFQDLLAEECIRLLTGEELRRYGDEAHVLPAEQSAT